MTQTPDILRFHEGSIVLPEGYEDRTANVLVPGNTETQPNLSIARDRLKEGEDLAAYVTRQISVLKARIPGHKVADRRPERLGTGNDALEGERIDALYKNGGKVVHQRQAAFLLEEGKALILSASSQRPFQEAFENLWKNWLESYLPWNSGQDA